MRVDLMNRLIEIMDQVSETGSPFNLGSWASGSLPNTMEPDNREICGTTCCAMGYAALDPVFRQEGLRLVIDHSYTPKTFSGLNRYLKKDAHVWSRGDLVFKGSKSMTAAARVLDIPEDTAEELFEFSGYDKRRDDITPRDVAAALHLTVVKHQARVCQGGAGLVYDDEDEI